MDSEFGEMISSANRNRMMSTYSAVADITLEDAETNVANAERFVVEVRSMLNY